MDGPASRQYLAGFPTSSPLSFPSTVLHLHLGADVVPAQLSPTLSLCSLLRLFHRFPSVYRLRIQAWSCLSTTHNCWSHSHVFLPLRLWWASLEKWGFLYLGIPLVWKQEISAPNPASPSNPILILLMRVVVSMIIQSDSHWARFHWWRGHCADRQDTFAHFLYHVVEIDQGLLDNYFKPYTLFEPPEVFQSRWNAALESPGNDIK